MNIIKFIRRLFHLTNPIELSDIAIADMDYYEKHKDMFPKRPELPEINDIVWFLGKDRVAVKGVVTDHRIKHGKHGVVVRFGPRPTDGKFFAACEPLFYNREDLLMYSIGDCWREIARLWQNLAATDDKHETVLLDYTTRRVADCKRLIERFEAQLILRSPADLEDN